MKKIFLILLLLCSNAFADLTDIKFGRYQIADSQWNVSACLYTTTCQIYSKSPGTAYKIPWTSGQVQWATGDYVKFDLSGNGSFPYTAKQYDSAGNLKSTLGNGKIVNMGPDYFFFVGSDNNTGQLFSGSSGMSNTGGVTWTGTLNPTIAQANTYANATYSTVPLSSGQTATSTPNSSTPSTPVVSMKPIYNTSTNLYTTSITPTSYNSPSSEGAANAFDNNPYTKYLNFDKYSAGVTIKLNQGRVVSGFKLTTANDFSGRDPTSYKLYASNDGQHWDKLGEGTLTLTENRYTVSDMISVANTKAYFYYYIYFPTTKAGEGCGQNCNSMQIGDITYYYDENNTTTSVDATPTSGTVSNPGTSGAIVAGETPTWPATSDITTSQTSQRNAARTRVANIQLGNSIYLDQQITSSNNSITIEQTGFYNKISGLNGTDYAIVKGSNNNINIKQGDSFGRNLIEFSVVGSSNNITMLQSRDPSTGLRDGYESGGHYIGLNVLGSTNTLSIKQGNDGGLNSGHFAYVDVTGSNNNGTLKQSGDGEKTFFGIINGSQNVFDITQQGSGSYFDLTLTGNGHNVTANQKDAGSHKATVNLTNAGGASTVSLIQQGSTAQNINITQQCATLSGCSVTVTQGQ